MQGLGMNKGTKARTAVRSRLPSAVGAGATFFLIGQLHAPQADVNETAAQKPAGQLSTVVVQGQKLDDTQKAERTLKDDPKQANPTSVSVSVQAHHKQPGSTWIASKTQYTFDGDSNLEAGLVYHDSARPRFDGSARLRV
jgi:hypothetical protein